VKIRFNYKKEEKERIFFYYATKFQLDRLIERTKLELTKEKNPYQIAILRAKIEFLEKDKQDIFKNDNQKYKKKFGEKIENTVRKAKQGSENDLFQLISWNKEWLFEDWVKNKILVSKNSNNQRFMVRLANAIKCTTKQKTVHGDINNYLEGLKARGFNFNNNRYVKRLFDYLIELSRSLEVPEHNKTWRLLDDWDYFNKYLKRHGLKDRH